MNLTSLSLTMILIIGSAEIVNGAPQNQILVRNPRFLRSWFPSWNIFDYFGSWFGEPNRRSYDVNKEGSLYNPHPRPTSTILSVKVSNPIRDLFTRATETASNAFSGVRNSISNTVSSISGMFYGNSIQSANTKPNGEGFTDLQEETESGLLGSVFRNKGITTESGFVKKYDWREKTNATTTTTTTSTPGFVRYQGVPEDIYDMYLNENKNSLVYDQFYDIKGSDKINVENYGHLKKTKKPLNDLNESLRADPLKTLSFLYKKMESSLMKNK